MATNDILQQFEALVLTAVHVLGEDAYGATVHEKVEEFGKFCSIGAIYTTLDRLEQKGYVKSWFGDPGPERGQRRKRYFQIQAAGQRALQEAVRVSSNMIAAWEGTA